MHLSEQTGVESWKMENESKNTTGKEMGRKTKVGLEYFPFDIDFFQDIKIRKLIKYQGGKSVAVYLNLLCTIYRDGYYIRWDEELPFIISEQTGLEEVFIHEVIQSCLSIGLFDKKLFTTDKVLSSTSIQTRYRDISHSSKRKATINEYNLLEAEIDFPATETEISSERTVIYSEEIPINSAEMPQSKVKESKVNQSKGECIVAKADPTPSPAEKTKEQRAHDFGLLLVPYLEKYSQKMIRDFYNYWTESNPKGRKMRFEMQKVFDISRRLATWNKIESEKITKNHPFDRKGVTINESIQALVGEPDNQEPSTDNMEVLDFTKLIGL